MKVLFASLFLMVVCGSAQTAADPSEPPGLIVLEKKWDLEIRNPSLERNPMQAVSERAEEDAARRAVERSNEQKRAQGMPESELPTKPLRRETGPSGPTATYIYEVKVRNNGKKEIRAVTWEYVFFSPDTGQEVGRRRFESRVRIGKGKTRNLVMKSALPPTGTIDAGKPVGRSPERYLEKIVIISVEYADDTRWQTPDEEISSVRFF